SALSTFKVGRVWLFFVSVLGPVVLAYMLIAKIVELIGTPYEGYDSGYLLIVGWGSVAVMIVVSILLTVSPWRTNPDRFTPWPTIADVPKRSAVAQAGQSPDHSAETE